MPCVHLRQLIQLCQDHHLKIAGSDVVNLVCEQCGQQEVCPDVLTDEYDAREVERPASDSKAPQDKPSA
ncbi:MAG: hypothetical protein KDA41_03420 [Planctomycetales bacterium]|nr:hypothetical protein [Planctomycetales bacterium]